ncbi:DNA ligase 1-like [Harpegnathos saltator]|uniref:DNA ligase 1-like n=1 Tax=Harpegnathos saltator TaxID=610380 RepID=UPI000DBEE9A6|nr:DNA ligase 1-like [Harpegnathos saltator]
MRPAVNSDESVTANRSARITSHDDYPSRGRKEQIPGSGSAQTKYETHLSRNDAHPSTYGSTQPLDWHVANREWCVQTMLEDQSAVPGTSDGTSQKHQGVDSPPRRYQSTNTDDECGVKPRLWCANCYRKKKKIWRELELAESTRRLLGRIKKRCKESEKPDDEAVAGVSSAPYRESISRPSAPEKSKRSRKQGAAIEPADTDVTERSKKERKARRYDEQERERRRERKEREKKERRERREREERILRAADARAAAPADFLKSCCYLCAQNTLAIAGFKPERSDKGIQVSAHKFHAGTAALDKSCSAILLVRTVQSSVKVKTRETSTLCPGRTTAWPKDTKAKAKRRKLSVFPGLMWTKCPARRHAACETDKPGRRDNAEKPSERPRDEKCCRAKRTA